MTLATAAPLVLDTRSLALDERCLQVIESFDRLQPGERLRVVTDADPGPLLHHFQVERSGAFEWTPVESGRTQWTTEVYRRAANVGQLRRVTEALGWDHDRLDELGARAFAERAVGRFESARGVWAAFSAGLRRHIRFEEEVLFPVFESETGLSPDAGPTAVMRAEHRAIERLLEGIAATVALPHPGADAHRAELLSLLRGHNEKEELVVYPGTDHFLASEESDALVGRFQEQAAVSGGADAPGH